MDKPAALWNGYDPAYYEYEDDFVPTFPWTQPEGEDIARYRKGEDGYWYAPGQQNSGKAMLRLTGDLMCEPAMCRRNRYGDTYFFHPCYQYVRELLKDADLCVGNLETTVTDLTPYAGQYHVIPFGEKFKYHCNAPECYLDAVRYAGFDVLVNANNHNCDSGILGLKQTLDRLDAHGFMHTGTFRPGDDRVLLVKVNGIRLAILSYGSRYNDLELMWTGKGIDSWLNRFDREKAQRDVAYARKMGAEYIIAYIHWGKDYDMEPNEKQLAILPQLAQTGVDYIVGSHTHCLQRYDRVVGKDGKTVPVMFSMGNFVTNETKELCKHTGILQLQLQRTQNGVKVEEAFIPCYVFDEFGTGRYCVVPSEPQFAGVDMEKLQRVREYVRERIGPQLPEVRACGASLGQLCQAMGLEVPEKGENTPVLRLCTSMGATCPGGIYFARGDETRQEKLLVVKNLVAAVVSSVQWEEFPVILCEDVAQAYEKACACLRPGRFCKVIAITGSRGKTLTKDLLCHALSKKFRVLTHKDTWHADVGIWQKAQAHHDFCVVEVREDEHLGMDTVMRALGPDYVLCTDAFTWAENVELPFDWQKNCAGGVAAFVKALGITDPFAGFEYESVTQNITEFDGVKVVYDLACRDPQAVVERAKALSGRLLVMGAQLPKIQGAAFQWDASVLNERERELAVLEVLRPGDVLVLCGDRALGLNVTLRRLFGLCDGYIPGGR